MLFLWQLAQAVVRWAPASGKRVWEKTAPLQEASEYLWHVSHVVGNPEAAWGGFFEFWKSCMWQAEQGLVGTVV